MNRFIINLRSIDAPGPYEADSRWSQFSPPNFRIPESFPGNIGEDLREGHEKTPDSDSSMCDPGAPDVPEASGVEEEDGPLVVVGNPEVSIILFYAGYRSDSTLPVSRPLVANSLIIRATYHVWTQLRTPLGGSTRLYEQCTTRATRGVHPGGASHSRDV